MNHKYRGFIKLAFFLSVMFYIITSVYAKPLIKSIKRGVIERGMSTLPISLRSVEIKGEGFVNIAEVYFDGVPSTAYTVLNEGNIVAIPPSEINGAVSITVEATLGAGGMSDAYVYSNANNMQKQVNDANKKNIDEHEKDINQKHNSDGNKNSEEFL
jgi:hypothetical protein